MARFLLLALLAALCGCRDKQAASVSKDRPSWESVAKGYEVEGAWPVLGQGRGHIRITEDSGDGRLFDFALGVGPCQDWSAAKAGVKRFWGWGDAAEEDTANPDGDSPPRPQRLRAAPHVREMSLVLDGKPVQIPEAAYVDLVDLRVGRGMRLLYADGPRYLLYLDGSDAGESYRVKYTIENCRIVKREIWHGEFPEVGPEVITF